MRYFSIIFVKEVKRLDYSQLRKSAREALRGKWGLAVGFTLLYMILSQVVVGFISPGSFSNFHGAKLVDYVVSLVWDFLIGGALSLGLNQFVLNIIRYRNARIEDLFVFFRGGRYGKSIGYAVLTYIYVLLWSLLFIIPGIIKGYSYAMTGYILVDHPDYTVNEAIRKSREIMSGNKLDLFVLQLTFLGWGFLSLLTLGIGFLWLIPYYYAAEAQFYRQITEKAV
jgi:uncharacterized membrane protein